MVLSGNGYRLSGKKPTLFGYVDDSIKISKNEDNLQSLLHISFTPGQLENF